MKEAVIYDCDGTLVDVVALAKHFEKYTYNPQAFYDAIAYAPPIEHVLENMKKDDALGRAILLVTARPERYRKETLYWMLVNAPDVRFGLWMRGDEDFRPDFEVKKDILAEIRQVGYDVQEAWEDSPSVIEMWKSEGITVNEVKGYGFY